jgi:hypothetical protein
MQGDEFPSWRSFWMFQREVAAGWRYVRSPDAQHFLQLIAQQSHGRVHEFAAGRQFFRAQVDHHDAFDEQAEDYFPGPALPARMKPLRDRASEGRANSKGIPCLYMAGDVHTAIAEVRPWIGSLVSVGVFKTRRPLRLVDCTRDVEKQYIFIDGEPSPELRAKAVWSHIARAFREPVMRDDNRADYAATQVIAELFRAEGFDGLAYRTAFGSDRFNVAIFDLEAAELLTCALHEIKDVELKHDETANPYYVQTDADGSESLVRNVIVGFSALPPDRNGAS